MRVNITGKINFAELKQTKNGKDYYQFQMSEYKGKDQDGNNVYTNYKINFFHNEKTPEFILGQIQNGNVASVVGDLSSDVYEGKVYNTIMASTFDTKFFEVGGQGQAAQAQINGKSVWAWLQKQEAGTLDKFVAQINKLPQMRTDLIEEFDDLGL